VVAVATAFVVAAVMVVPGTASASDSFAPQRFAADSGDSCRYGYTEGYLSWRWARAAPQALAYAVDVSGTLVDQPAASNDIVCRDDRYYSVATFVAYSGGTVVDRHAERVDNGVLRLSFTLGDNATRAGLATLVVQVCRSPLNGTGYSYCGRAQTYAPVWTIT
jgi:hypothetical protein